MSTFRLRKVASVFTLFFLLLFAQTVDAADFCGDHLCKPSKGENCSTCPADCGCTSGLICVSSICVVPPPTPTPTPSPTPTSTPTPTPSLSPTPTPSLFPSPTVIPVISPTPTPTSSSNNASTSSPTPSVSYYPNISLTRNASIPTNSTRPVFTGSVTIEKGTIRAVEFSITQGAEWLSTVPADGSFNASLEYFAFTPPTLSDGNHSILIRAVSDASVVRQMETNITIVTTPPTVVLLPWTSPTSKKTPTITGKATAQWSNIVEIQVSLDGGKSWLTALPKPNFSFVTQELEDGNYEVTARARDNAGNIGYSPAQTLIIDTLPPIIGGGIISNGVQTLTPNENGDFDISEGVITHVAIGMRGGVIKAKMLDDEQHSIDLTFLEDANIWQGDLVFHKQGRQLLSVQATDGAGNTTSRLLQNIVVQKPGSIRNEVGEVVSTAEITVYVYEPTTLQWLVWDGAVYGQENPQKTSQEGNYSFALPAGRYYFKISAPGYSTNQSDIKNFQTATTLNSDFILKKQPLFEFSFPFMGKVQLKLPSLSALESANERLQDIGNTTPQEKKRSLIYAPDFTLTRLNGNEVQLDEHIGKKWLLSFLSVWSPLAGEQASIFSGISPSDADILVVMLQESLSASQSFMSRGGHNFDVALDPFGQIGEKYNVTFLPSNYFINSRGEIHRIYNGVLTKDQIVNIFKEME